MTGKEAKERLQKQYKRQNNAIKENYDRISATLPKGTIDRIKALGLTINGVANDAILSFLDCAEEVEQNAAEELQNTQEAKEERAEKPKTEISEDLQALFYAKKAEIEAAKQEQEAHKEEKRAETIAAAKFAEE